MLYSLNFCACTRTYTTSHLSCRIFSINKKLQLVEELLDSFLLDMPSLTVEKELFMEQQTRNSFFTMIPITSVSSSSLPLQQPLRPLLLEP